MNLFVRMVVCLITSVFLLGCESNKEEDLTVELNYTHQESQPRYRTGARPVLISKHHIEVRDSLEKYIYDSTVLNESLTGTVLIPVDVNLEVEYKNYTFEHPQLHYESGISQPFSVSHSSPPTATVTVSVDINPNYPVPVAETIDNETVETVTTHTFSWSDNFTRGSASTQQQKTSYIQFWDNASNSTWDNISIGNSDNMTWCDNSTMINDTIANFDNATYEFRGVYCNGMYWTFGRCGWGNEISAHDKNVGDCACQKSTDNSYTVRPLISNANWGGVGKSCSANSQTLQVILKRSDGNSL